MTAYKQYAPQLLQRAIDPERPEAHPLAEHLSLCPHFGAAAMPQDPLRAAACFMALVLIAGDGIAGMGTPFNIGAIKRWGKFRNAAQAVAIDDMTAHDQDFGLINQGGGLMQQCWIKTAPNTC